MIEPVHLANFFTVFFSAAMVILCGGLYALVFAFARVKGQPRLMPLAYAGYAGLVVATGFLAWAAHLLASPFWSVVVALMLLGYFAAPHAIWHLCLGTHAHEPDSRFPTPDRSV